MPSRDRLPPWHERHRLPNGRELLIRPVRPEDAGPLRAGFALLEPEAARRRLVGAADIAAADAQALARPNPRTEFTLVASEPDDPGHAVIAALVHIQTDPAGFEGRFVLLATRFVAGLGLRRYLLTRVAKWARSRGVAMLQGVLPADDELLRLADTLGFRRLEAADDSGLVPVVLELRR